MHLFERVSFLADSDRDGAEANRSTLVVFRHDTHDAFIHLIEAAGIDFEQLQCAGSDVAGDLAIGSFLSEVAHEVDQVVDDTWRAAGTGGNFLGPSFIDLDFKQTTGSMHDAREGGHIVVVEAGLQREARAQRSGEQSRTGGRSDQGEFGNR